MREKLVELIKQIVIPFWAGQIADHLISNDVVPVVRCKDCEHCMDAHGDGFMYCMRPIEAPDYSETGYCYPLEVRVGFYGFCSYGERKDGAE